MSIDPARTALVIIDMNHWSATPERGMARVLTELGADTAEYWQRVEEQVVPNIAELLVAFRGAGARVVFTEGGSFFTDGADSQPHMRPLYLSANAVNADPDCRTRPELAPQPGEAVLVKPSSSAWTSTPIDFLLRQAGVDTVFFAGVVTNGCVMLSALGAWDHGYTVEVVEDATAALEPRQHALALEVFAVLGITTASTYLTISRFAP